MKKKGFTLVELLVVISIIALLMAILMPTLAKVRSMALRAVCSTNLSSLHKACVTYAHDNNDDYPRAGGKGSTWRATANLPIFYADSEVEAFYQGADPDNISRATMGASLYYLIKYADAAPKEFLCGGDRGSEEFELNLYSSVIPSTCRLAVTQDITLAWDFGGPAGLASAGGIPPGHHYSFAYQIPYGGARQQYYALSLNRQPDTPVMADRNPYFVLIEEDDRPLYDYGNDLREQYGNSPNHKYEGQNVLYNDASTSWQNVSYCGIGEDNIYTIALSPAIPPVGVQPRLYRSGDNDLSQGSDDALLVNEGYEQPGVAE